MLKKVAKALDEMAKNDELMAGIMAAAGGMEDDGAYEGNTEGFVGDDYQDAADQAAQQRLITIGEDGEEDRQFDTNKDNSRRDAGPQMNFQKKVEEEDDYAD